MTSFGFTDAERKRVDTVDRLVVRGETGVSELVTMMADPSWTVRRAVVGALAVAGDDAVAPLCAWLRNVRAPEHAIAAAVDALAASLGPTATPACIALLTDPRPAVAADAAQILGRRRATQATPMLAQALGHADDNVAVAAIEALGAINGGHAVDALVLVLSSGNFFRVFPALQVLVRTGDPRTIAPIAALLADERYRFEATRALGRTGLAQAIQPLASLLPGAGDEVVRLVALALADLLERAKLTGAIGHVVATMHEVIRPSMARFVIALRRADGAARAAIATVLGRIGDASAVPELVRLLDDVDARAAATAAIRRISREDDSASLAATKSSGPAARAEVLQSVRTALVAPQVRELLADEDPEVRARACDALARIGDTSAVPLLFEALADASPRVTHAATAAIHSLGVPDTAARTIEVLRTGSPSVRQHALRIVAYMGFESAFEAVVAAAADPDERLAELAVAALALLTHPRVEPVLGQLARDPREAVRAAAMRTLAKRASGTASRQLADGLRDEGPWVRYYAVQGLGRLGDVAALDLVIARLADASPFVRMAAIEALGHLDVPAAWEALCAVASADDVDARRTALASLALGTYAGALPYLLAGAEAPEIATRLIALSGLARRTEPEALAALVAAALGPTPECRDAALSLLGDRDDDAAAGALVDIALATAPDAPAHRTLSLPGAARGAAIRTRLHTADEHNAERLVNALARRQDVTALVDALALENPAVRRAAARALVALGDVAALTRLASEDPDLEVRQISASAV